MSKQPKPGGQPQLLAVQGGANPPRHNELDEMRRTLEVLCAGRLVEVRSIGWSAMSGYFRDLDNLLHCVARHPQETFYFVFNEINEQCYAKEQREKLMPRVKSATADADITHRKWVLIDVDPVRAGGISADAQEKRHARETLGRVHDYLRDVGFEEPVAATSGNGYHLLYAVHMTNKPEHTELVRRFLLALDMLFGNEHATVDTSVYNAARITKLYGVWARKGADTPERPHRPSRLLRVPAVIRPTSAELLRQVAAQLPEPPTPVPGMLRAAPFDLQSFMDKHGLRTVRTTAWQGGVRHVLEHCPFDPAHKAPDAAIFEMADGAIGFKCFHNACAGRGWRAVRALFDPKAAERAREQPRRLTPGDVYGDPAAGEPQAADGSPGTVDGLPEGAQGEAVPPPRLRQLHEIDYRDRDGLVTVRSGFEALDRKLVGFNKGELSVWSGGNGAGKSTMLLQLAMEAVQQGFKVAMFSGELAGSRVKEWAHLIAAGRQYTKPTRHEGVHYVPSAYGALIDGWCRGKLWLYNNDYGTSFTAVMDTLRGKIKEEGVDVLVLDNLMSFDLRDLPGDKWERQTTAAIALSKLARDEKIHIHFVCHPRKETGLLRKTDISGTSDLTNVADNVLMAHRVNRDFQRYAGEFFGKVRAQQYFEFDNVIEVMKNRDLGIGDLIVGLYFEPQSKRYLNRRHENRTYGWVDSIPRDAWTRALEDGAEDAAGDGGPVSGFEDASCGAQDAPVTAWDGWEEEEDAGDARGAQERLWAAGAVWDADAGAVCGAEDEGDEEHTWTRVSVGDGRIIHI